MNMKRLLSLVAAALTLAGCAAMNQHNNSKNPYEKKLFVEKYLDPAHSQLDAQIQRSIDGLRALPHSAALHNQLGQLLIQKGFPKDAETEFERAINDDHHFYPAWYNLGLVRMSRGNFTGAHIAFLATVHQKPGHSQALFQLGLMEEQRGHIDAAIDYYAKAISINHALLDVHSNPRILDTKLIDLALLHLYPKEHARASMRFIGTPSGYAQQGLEAPSTQASAQQIVTPVPPLTDLSQQVPPPTPGQPVAPMPQPATPPKPPM
jgi:tetratricopeptide (TPR) repeat protein